MSKGTVVPSIEQKPYLVERKYGVVRYTANVNAVKALILGDLKEIGEKADYYHDTESIELVERLRQQAHEACTALWTTGAISVEGVVDALTGVKYSVKVTDRRRVVVGGGIVKHLRSLVLSLCLIFGCALIGGSVEPATALTNCTIVASQNYTSTRCAGGSNAFYSQRAKHTCVVSIWQSYIQQGYIVAIHQVSSAGACYGTIINRLVQQW